MMRLILRECRRTVGHVLQVVGTRMRAVPGAFELEGDGLTLVGMRYGCERQTDAEYREYVVAIARGAVDDKAVYRPPPGVESAEAVAAPDGSLHEVEVAVSPVVTPGSWVGGPHKYGCVCAQCAPVSDAGVHEMPVGPYVKEDEHA